MSNLLWFVGQSDCHIIEIVQYLLKVWVSVVNDNSYVNHLIFYLCISCTNGKTAWFYITFEPSQEKSVPSTFFTIGCVAHIEQHMLIKTEELIDDG